MKTAYLGLGSNLGNKSNHLNDAITQISCHPDITVTQVSPFYKTDPIGFIEQDWFLNAVVEIQTTLKPEALLKHCQTIEQNLKRVRTHRWGPRTLDIDILLYTAISMSTAELTIPP